MLRELKADETKAKIISASYALFKERGVEDVTLGDIGALAGVSQASVYRHFGNKSRLLLASYCRLWEEIIDDIKAETVALEAFHKASGYCQMEQMISAFEAVYLNHVEFLRFALGCKLFWIRMHFAVDPDTYDKMMHPILQIFNDVVNKGLLDGTIHVPNDPESCCFAIWGCLRAYVEQGAILETFYSGENRYRTNFEVMRSMILKSIK